MKYRSPNPNTAGPPNKLLGPRPKGNRKLKTPLDPLCTRNPRVPAKAVWYAEMAKHCGKDMKFRLCLGSWKGPGTLGLIAKNHA